MSSASAGSLTSATMAKNAAKTNAKKRGSKGSENFGGTSACSAEAEQGEGPAAASATSSAVGDQDTSTTAVSSVASSDYAAASCPIAVVAVGPNSASAASEAGTVSVSPNGAAAATPAANGSKTATFDGPRDPRHAEILSLLRKAMDEVGRTD